MFLDYTRNDTPSIPPVVPCVSACVNWFQSEEEVKVGQLHLFLVQFINEEIFLQYQYNFKSKVAEGVCFEFTYEVNVVYTNEYNTEVSQIHLK